MTMSRRRVAVATVALALAVGLSGCDPSAPKDDEAAPPPSSASPSRASVSSTPSAGPLAVAWSGLPDVVSGPVDADGTAVAYVAKKKRLYLVGLDARSGDELWRRAASPGEVVTGIGVVPHVIDGKVVYFRPSSAGNLYARLVVADPRSGKDVVATGPMLFRSPPTACDDDPRSVCLDARKDYDTPRTSYRLTAAAGATLHVDKGLEGRSIGDHGLREVRGSGEFLARYVDGEQRWRASVRSVFGASYSTDYGWDWRYDAATDRFYGEVGHRPSSADTTGTRMVHPTDWAMAALDAATGDVAWHTQGVSYLCDGSLDVPSGADDAAPLPVRCRTTGSLVYRGTSGSPERRKVAVTIEGFDPATGDTTWKVAQGDTPQLLGGWTSEGSLPRTGVSGVVVRVDGAPTVLDLATGATSRVDEDAALWCEAERSTFDYDEPYYVDGKPQHRRFGDTLYSRCDASARLLGVKAAGSMTSVPAGTGVTIDGTTLVATPDGIVAFR